MSADTGPTTTQDRPDPVGPGAPPRGRTGGLFASEVLTLFRRRRTQAILGVLAGVPILIAVAVKLSSAPRPGEGPPLLDRVTQNGLFVGVTALVVSVPLFVPLAIGVVAGDTIAGEANLGTLRYLLLAPAGRTRLLAVKYASTAVFCFAATLTVVLTGAVVGGALFGLRPVTLLSGDAVSVPESFVRALLVAAYVSVSMLGMSAIGLFVSTLTEIPVGAMAATVTLAVTSQILGGIPQVDWLHPYLFSHHWLDLGDLLRTPVVWDSFVANGRLQLAYVAVFTALAWARLTTKDVLS
ncbi:ABC transporter permease [Kineosporia sp. A_224]|uniref:ABC transporter permease n=1 Tax=Kineosporia sp. A_224 TaxID=1962180 RepID=UPI000B4BB18F|nr:ABC transporter permease [Kineosporia sp. A_224]